MICHARGFGDKLDNEESPLLFKLRGSHVFAWRMVQAIRWRKPPTQTVIPRFLSQDLPKDDKGKTMFAVEQVCRMFWTLILTCN